MSGSEPPRLALPSDIALLEAGLRALAADLGDPFAIRRDVLEAALFGPCAYGFALVAGGQGVLLAQPRISTATGGALSYVSDLWVAQAARGAGLGQRLLALAAQEGAARWGALGLCLSVYAENAGAMAFYDRLGFALLVRDRIALLTGPALSNLMEGQA